ncbi:DUF2637 domain-containing protein [Actinomadura gamaensis]|uniref:DUF2637 domain-containing protein n=1 Tax=Actinomadura gamaensis TaxID=1763541 RepID=A0ABV9UD54_9ACTN
MDAPTDRLIRATTTASVALLALIAAVVSYRHMHHLAQAHGESRWTAALIPLSVDGMIVASSMSVLSANRSGRREGRLAWTLLIIGTLASLAANVAVAEPTTTGRIIAAWPSFALVGAYEMLMSQLRSRAPAGTARPGTARLKSRGFLLRRRRKQAMAKRFVGVPFRSSPGNGRRSTGL